jgi:predicted Zn-dependent protease
MIDFSTEVTGVIYKLIKLAVDLPFSRKLETEADQIGLKMMAKACYDPRGSIHVSKVTYFNLQ